MLSGTEALLFPSFNSSSITSKRLMLCIKMLPAARPGRSAGRWEIRGDDRGRGRGRVAARAPRHGPALRLHSAVSVRSSVNTYGHIDNALSYVMSSVCVPGAEPWGRGEPCGAGGCWPRCWPSSHHSPARSVSTTSTEQAKTDSHSEPRFPWYLAAFKIKCTTKLLVSLR